MPKFSLMSFFIGPILALSGCVTLRIPTVVGSYTNAISVATQDECQLHHLNATFSKTWRGNLILDFFAEVEVTDGTTNTYLSIAPSPITDMGVARQANYLDGQKSHFLYVGDAALQTSTRGRLSREALASLIEKAKGVASEFTSNTTPTSDFYQKKWTIPLQNGSLRGEVRKVANAMDFDLYMGLVSGSGKDDGEDRSKLLVSFMLRKSKWLSEQTDLQRFIDVLALVMPSK